MKPTARCYCGHVEVSADQDPVTVVYCHCSDCRRWTGAPLPAFAAFLPNTITLSRPIKEQEHSPGVMRRHCPDCGSPLTARFSYIKDQVYVPLGIFDDLTPLEPRLHCHADKAVTWLHLTDTLPRENGSARDTLNAAT